MLLDNEIIVDLFAGGGGASSGIGIATGRDPDIAINHDEIALAMHEANHPSTKHFRQDIREVHPKMVTHGRPVGLLWASPDCKHFSKAKGSAPERSREIRSLAWVVEKWAYTVRPRIIILENVEEFKKWGPLDKDGKVIKSQEGSTFKAFRRRINRIGYNVEHKELRACDYGAPTIRKRLFLIARCDGLPIVWPEPTHGPDLIPYRTAADIIDWSLPCPSIFDRKKPLVENTMRRIAEGIRRYVVETAEPFIINYYGPKKPGEFRGSDLYQPIATQTTENRFGLIVPHVQRQFGNSVGNRVKDPVGTITAGGLGKTALVSAFLTEHANASGQRTFDPNEPLRTQCATTKGGHFALVSAFMAQHNGGFYDGAGRSMNDPLSTITYRGTQQQLVTSNLVKFRGTSKAGQSIKEPLHTVTAGGNHIAEVRAFLIKYYKTGGQWQSCNSPLHTVMTKDRIGLITVMIHGEPYVITDIGMRMLQPRELFRAQGFSDQYLIDVAVNGKRITKGDQVRCCGNSVCPPLAQALAEANLESIPLRKTAN